MHRLIARRSRPKSFKAARMKGASGRRCPVCCHGMSIMPSDSRRYLFRRSLSRTLSPCLSHQCVRACGQCRHVPAAETAERGDPQHASNAWVCARATHAQEPANPVEDAASAPQVSRKTTLQGIAASAFAYALYSLYLAFLSADVAVPVPTPPAPALSLYPHNLNISGLK